ncbi:MAG: biopolymer transporter ExbD [Rhodoferax sp.]|jgi:biopolymer transport protein ExbD|nr:biopolymer transporter ExbD [Rhodoferax sp.]
MKVETETKPYDTINVTPMLDLAYVLLVIFIIMTTASVQGMKINLPKPSNKPSTVQKEVRIVQILPDGNLLLNGAAITLPELEQRLTAAIAKDKDAPVMIKGDPQAHYVKVVEIIDMAGRLGIGNVGLVTARIGT